MSTGTITTRPAQRSVPPAPAAKQRDVKRLLGRVALYAALVAASLALLMPFYWMVMSSLKTNNEIFTFPIRWWPETEIWSNYLDIWQKSRMTTWLKNTLFLAVVITFLQVLTGSFAAYGFAKVRFPGRNALFLGYIATIAVPWQSYMIPQFVLMSKFHLHNTLWAMVVLQAFGAFGVFLMKQYYESIPEELSEAARIDGLSEYGIWWKIMVPLSIPAVASLALLTFVNTWNDFLGPLIYLRDPDIRTIQLGLRTFIGEYTAEYSLIFTGSVLSVLPIAIIFMLGQRFFIEGIATTGLKG